MSLFDILGGASGGLVKGLVAGAQNKQRNAQLQMQQAQLMGQLESQNLSRQLQQDRLAQQDERLKQEKAVADRNFLSIQADRKSRQEDRDRRFKLKQELEELLDSAAPRDVTTQVELGASLPVNSLAGSTYRTLRLIAPILRGRASVSPAATAKEYRTRLVDAMKFSKNRVDRLTQAASRSSRQRAAQEDIGKKARSDMTPGEHEELMEELASRHEQILLDLREERRNLDEYERRVKNLPMFRGGGRAPAPAPAPQGGGGEVNPFKQPQ
jgi:hypothetical protein